MLVSLENRNYALIDDGDHDKINNNQLKEVTNKTSSFCNLFSDLVLDDGSGGGYLWTFTNETECEKTLSFLHDTLPLGNTAICVGGLFALDAVSMRNIDYLLIMDCSPMVESFWKQMTPLIKQSNSREDLKKKMVEEITLKKDSRVDFDKTTLIQDIEMQGKISFFSSEERYNRIRRIFQNDNFAFIQLDLYNLDISYFNIIGSRLKSANCKIDMVYTSNTEALTCLKNVVSERITAIFKSHLPVEGKELSSSYIYIDASDWDYGTDPFTHPVQRCLIKNEGS